MKPSFSHGFPMVFPENMARFEPQVESGRAMVTSNRVGASVVVLPGAADGTGPLGFGGGQPEIGG